MKPKSKLLLPLLLCVTLSATPSFGYYSYGNEEFPLLSTVKEYLKQDYVEKNLDDKKLEYGAIKGLLSALDDPYTRFMEPKNFQEMKIRMNGEFYGIGIHIGMKNDILTVIAPIEGTPADKAGLKSMDRILKIDGTSTEGMSLEEAVSRIRGPKGSIVKLSLIRLPKKEIFDVALARDKIKLEAVDKVEVFREKVGYIRLNTFESQTATKEVERGLRKLMQKNIKAVILDLRNNGGGLLRNAITISSLFMKEGAVVHTVNRDGEKTTEFMTGSPIFEHEPVIILVNEGSASASEIVAGSMKDNGRGTIVGTHTFGKASVQKIMNLPDGSAVLVTIAKYYTPKMIDISKVGIAPDVLSEIPTENYEAAKDPNYVYSYDKDPQLQKAIDIAISKLK